jgi:hypothetical protein
MHAFRLVVSPESRRDACSIHFLVNESPAYADQALDRYSVQTHADSRWLFQAPRVAEGLALPKTIPVWDPQSRRELFVNDFRAILQTE